MKIGIQLPVVNTFDGAVWGDEVMAVGLANALSELDGVTFAEVYDPVGIHDNLDVVLHLYPFTILRHVQGPRHYWWYQAPVQADWPAHPRWRDYLNLYDGIFVAAPALKRHLLGWGVPPEKISLMPMSCDLKTYRRRPPDPRFAHDVVFCGNGGIRHPKHVRQYLLPLRDLGLKIYGANWEEHPEIQDCLMGPIPPRDVPTLYSSAKIVLSTHALWHTVSGIPTSRFWEALACEAVVVSDRVRFAEQIFGNTVVWTEGFNDVREKVAYLLAHDDEREALRGRGRKIVEGRMTFQAYAPKLFEIFRTGSMREIFAEKGDDTTMSRTETGGGPGIAPGCGFPGDWIQKGEDAFAAGNTTEAIECFENALQLDPLHAKTHSNLGVIHWHNGEVEKALRSLTRALELDPDDQDVIMNCCMIFEVMGKTEDARDILNAYLQKNPWDDEVRQKLESLESAPQQPCQAPLPADARAEMPFSPAEFLNQQGEEQFKCGRTDRARVCFEMAVEADPELASAHSNLGVIFWQEGDLDRALESLYRALDLNPDDPDIILNSAKVLAAAGETRTAADLFKVYLQRFPQDDDAWKDYEELSKKMNAPAWDPKGLPPEVADVYLRMSAQLRDAGDLAGASDAIDRALRIDSDRAEAYYLLGCSHRDRDECSEALNLFRQGLQKDSTHRELVLAAGELLEKEGNGEEAQALYDAFLSASSDEEVRSALKKLKKRAEKPKRETKAAAQ